MQVINNNPDGLIESILEGNVLAAVGNNTAAGYFGVVSTLLS